MLESMTSGMDANAPCQIFNFLFGFLSGVLGENSKIVRLPGRGVLFFIKRFIMILGRREVFFVYRIHRITKNGRYLYNVRYIEQKGVYHAK
ncbi:MAG TPA: hypothetical protein DDY31_08205 [Lachnospiraceae bacterium]|nr:hypothetical protein [Lachnospiraceae bacterium]